MFLGDQSDTLNNRIQNLKKTFLKLKFLYIFTFMDVYHELILC